MNKTNMSTSFPSVNEGQQAMHNTSYVTEHRARMAQNRGGRRNNKFYQSADLTPDLYHKKGSDGSQLRKTVD